MTMFCILDFQSDCVLCKAKVILVRNYFSLFPLFVFEKRFQRFFIDCHLFSWNYFFLKTKFTMFFWNELNSTIVQIPSISYVKICCRKLELRFGGGQISHCNGVAFCMFQIGKRMFSFALLIFKFTVFTILAVVSHKKVSSFRRELSFIHSPSPFILRITFIEFIVVLYMIS